MSGCSVINGRQHVGLQKLSALAGITRLSLGPNKNYKFVYDESSCRSTLVCSCVRVLETLDLSCCVGQLVLDVVRAHHSVYNTGSGCLVFVAGAWSRAALESLNRGISVSGVVSALTEGVEICLDVCRRSSVSIEGLGADVTSPGRRREPEASRTTVKLSRHFNEAASQRHRATPDVCHIADGLSHGSTDSMSLVLKAFQIQTDVDRPTFDVSRVMTCVVPGLSEQQSCVLPGCVFLLSPDQTSVALRLKHQSLNVAFINGDVSETFRHLGFRPTSTRLVSDRLPSNKQDEWASKVTSFLLKLQVKLLLVTGLVSETLIQRCCRCHILVVEKVKVSVLRCFAEATGGVVVTYATQLNQRCVGSGVTVDVWRRLNRDDDDGDERKVSAAVTVSAGNSGRLATAVITSRVDNKLQLMEDRFWSCAHRLHLALTDQRLLPGAGRTETLCVQQLQKRAERHESRPLSADRAEVLRLMADGLIDYVSTVVSNAGDVSKLRATTLLKQHLHDVNKRDVAEKLSQLLSDNDPNNKSNRKTTNVYDNLSVKQEVWRKASDLVVLVLQTDAEIVTNTDGLKENTATTLL